MSKKVLGKGLDALLSPKPEPIDQKSEAAPKEGGEKEHANEGVEFIRVDQIIPNPDQPRKEFREESLQELADSIQEQGIIQPIIAERAGENTYRIVAGERRLRAAKMAGLTEIPVIIKTFTREEKLEIALIENIQRDDLSPIEEAEAYQNLMNTTGLNQEGIAKKVGKKRSTIANSLRLLKMSETMRDALNDGTLTPGHARAILSLTNPADQELLYKRIVEKHLSVREAERQAGLLNSGKKSERAQKKSPASTQPSRKEPELEAFEQKLIEALGTKVVIKGNRERGKIEIDYYTMEDVERVYELLTQKNQKG